MLKSRKGDWQSIADGSGISYSWLSKFMNDHIENPGYATLKKLAAYLDKGAGNQRAEPAAEVR